MRNLCFFAGRSTRWNSFNSELVIPRSSCALIVLPMMPSATLDTTMSGGGFHIPTPNSTCHVSPVARWLALNFWYWALAGDGKAAVTRKTHRTHRIIRRMVSPFGARQWMHSSPAPFIGRRKAGPVSYTHLRAHETRHDLVCRLLLEKKKK